MDKRYRKNKEGIFLNLLKIIIFLFLAAAAIKVGMLGGDLVLKSEVHIVEGIDVENFKLALNKSLPIINTIYNSGNISMSFSGEVRSIVKRIFEFDLNNPITILNAQSPFLYSYYNNEYQVLIKQKEDEKNKVAIEEDEDKGEDNSRTQDDNEIEEPEPQYKEDSSSITYEEEKEHSGNEIVTKGKIAIQNETKFKIDESFINKLLEEPLKINFNKKGPQILIYHTHTSEGYLKNSSEINKKDIPSYTSDTRYSVVRVGQALYDSLRKKYGFNVIHNGTVNDYDFNSAYNTGYKTVTNILKGNPSIKVVFDIHRDGLSDKKSKLSVFTKINGKSTAKVMFVVGTSSRLSHPNWKENFKLALKLQEKLNSYSPGLARPINVDNNRFNQHVTNGALIIEVGGDGNTIDESIESTKYLARAISEVLKEK